MNGVSFHPIIFGLFAVFKVIADEDVIDPGLGLVELSLQSSSCSTGWTLSTLRHLFGPEKASRPKPWSPSSTHPGRHKWTCPGGPRSNTLSWCSSSGSCHQVILLFLDLFDGALQHNHIAEVLAVFDEVDLTFESAPVEKVDIPRNVVIVYLEDVWVKGGYLWESHLTRSRPSRWARPLCGTVRWPGWRTYPWSLWRKRSYSSMSWRPSNCRL